MSSSDLVSINLLMSIQKYPFTADQPTRGQESDKKMCTTKKSITPLFR